MDECDNLMNIDTPPSSDAPVLKRKLDPSAEELTFPCKKVAVSPVEKPIIQDVPMTPIKQHTLTNTTSTSVAVSQAAASQVKLSKAEREAVKAEKAKEKEMERLKREAEKSKREEERLKREEERLKKVLLQRHS
jgi:hypothetical protein